MLKLDYILSPKSNNGSYVKNLLMIDYENDVLTTGEWNDKNIKSDLKIKHLNIPKKCFEMRDTLNGIIELYELKNKVYENCNARLFLSYSGCTDDDVFDMGYNKDILEYEAKEKD
jgi:hypothetical protein